MTTNKHDQDYMHLLLEQWQNGNKVYVTTHLETMHPLKAASYASYIAIHLDYDLGQDLVHYMLEASAKA